MPFTTTIEGLGGAQFTGADYTNPALIQSFLTAMSQFYNVKTGTSTLTASDLANIQNQINFLAELAKNGVSINLDANNPGNPTSNGSNPGTSPNTTFYLTTDMVQILNTLFTSLSRVGDVNNLTLTDLNEWRNGTTTQNSNDIQNIFVALARTYAVLPVDPSTVTSALPNGVPSTISLNPTVAAQQIDRIFSQGNTFVSEASINGSTTRSLQAFTELHYVETANQVINQQLADMKQALQTTQGALNNLNQLQQLHNSITVASRTFTYNLAPPSSQIYADPFGMDINVYVAQYEKYASAQLKAALVPQLTNESLPFSLPASAVTIKATHTFSDFTTAASAILAGYNVPGSYPTVAAANAAQLAAHPPLTWKWTFSVTINDPSKYYAFNTSTNLFSSIPVTGTYSMTGYYVSSLSVNPSTFTYAQMAKIVGDGFNGVQKFPLIGTLSGMNTLQTQMTRQVTALSALRLQLANSTITPLSTLNDPLKRSQALVGQISAVLTDLKTNLGPITATTPTVTAAVGIRKWIMDNYQTFSSSSATNAGAIQQNLTNAINAAQSSNSTQTQKVNNSLLVFQQYYQSAAAVLTALTQMITKMAQKISQ